MSQSLRLDRATEHSSVVQISAYRNKASDSDFAEELKLFASLTPEGRDVVIRRLRAARMRAEGSIGPL